MKKMYLLAMVLLGLASVNAQNNFGNLQNQIPRDQRGNNQFDVKKDSVQFKGLSLDLGAAFSMQFQALNSFNDQPSTFEAPSKVVGYSLMNLENNFNLPGANMVIGAQLYDGVRVNLDVYLASRHHNETWVKGGYLQIDKLDFIKKDFLAGFMKYATIKIGQMENNYGDAHFRRSDNGSTLNNAFVGNNIMDSFTTDMGMEVYYNRSGWVSMLGITNSKLNQNVAEIIPTSTSPNTEISPSILAKLGYDKQIDKDLRVRITGSLYHCANTSSNLYSSSRSSYGFSGVMFNNAFTNGTTAVAANTFTTAGEGGINPGFGGHATSIMFNPFVKYKALEFFGTVEFASGGNTKADEKNRSFNQYAGDVVYRFGRNDSFYVAGKYNVVSGKLANADAKSINVNRFESSVGWFMTKNILAKLDYVNQNYNNYVQFASNGNPNNLYGGNFKGLVFEAVITF